MPKFGFLIVVVLTLAPVAAMAKTPAQNDYWHFALTDAEIAQMPNAADKACLAKADQEPFAVIQCNIPQFDRIEERLSQSYHGVMATLPKAQKDRLHSEQQLWIMTREAICKARVEDELNETSITYNAAVIQCALAELYRRTLWVERYR